MEAKRAYEMGVKWRDVRIKTRKNPVGPSLWRCYADGQELFQTKNVFEAIGWRRKLAQLQGDLHVEPVT